MKSLEITTSIHILSEHMNERPKFTICLDLTKEQEELVFKYLSGEITLRYLGRSWDDKNPQKTLNHIHNIILNLYRNGKLFRKV